MLFEIIIKEKNLLGEMPDDELVILPFQLVVLLAPWRGGEGPAHPSIPEDTPPGYTAMYATPLHHNTHYII
jgi:hypothetical protein